MIVSLSPRPRRLTAALVGAGLGAALTGCAEAAPEEAAAASSSAESSATAGEEPALSSEEELSAALLPAEAFGPDATVVTTSVQEIRRSTSGGLPEGTTVTPESCGPQVGSTRLSPEDFGAIVAQTATTGTGITVEVLAESEQIDAAAPQFDELLAQCPQVTATLPDGSTATVRSTPLELPALGDASGGVGLTTSVSAPDGSTLAIPSLLAVAVDGNRMVYLQQTGGTPAPLDPAAFTTLFEDAFEAQQNA